MFKQLYVPKEVIHKVYTYIIMVIQACVSLRPLLYAICSRKKVVVNTMCKNNNIVTYVRAGYQLLLTFYRPRILRVNDGRLHKIVVMDIFD